MTRIEVDRRIPRTCPACAEPRHPYTHPTAGTRIRALCTPNRCGIARMYALANGPRHGGFEPLPADDRHAPKTNLLGGTR